MLFAWYSEWQIAVRQRQEGTREGLVNLACTSLQLHTTSCGPSTFAATQATVSWWLRVENLFLTHEINHHHVIINYTTLTRNLSCMRLREVWIARGM